jgi:ketosteroid isomerase-like protein
MHPNAALIHRFYDCFRARDAAGMRACYHADVTFRDPAFGELDAERAAAMWAMLCASAADLAIDVSDVVADDAEGRAHWVARYTFKRTGRSVVNRIDARFRFRDGLIVWHEDTFDFWRWARQALGAPGTLLGWSDALRDRVRATAHRGLDRFVRDTAGPAHDAPGAT